MKRSHDAQRKKEFSRLKKTATALARKAAALASSSPKEGGPR